MAGPGKACELKDTVDIAFRLKKIPATMGVFFLLILLDSFRLFPASLIPRPGFFHML
jgi:hypothetical protein